MNFRFTFGVSKPVRLMLRRTLHFIEDRAAAEATRARAEARATEQCAAAALEANAARRAALAELLTLLRPFIVGLAVSTGFVPPTPDEPPPQT